MTQVGMPVAAAAVRWVRNNFVKGIARPSLGEDVGSALLPLIGRSTLATI